MSGEPPIASSGISSVPSWSVNALEIEGTNAFLEYGIVQTNGATNLICTRGSIFFWFSPSWASASTGGNGPGSYARLIDVGEYTSNASHGWWSLYTDPTGTNIFFGAQTNNAGATFLTAPIEWTSNEWHFVALTYSATNTALYMDGQLVTNGPGVNYWPTPAVLATEGFSIGSDSYAHHIPSCGVADPQESRAMV